MRSASVSPNSTPADLLLVLMFCLTALPCLVTALPAVHPFHKKMMVDKGDPAEAPARPEDTTLTQLEAQVSALTKQTSTLVAQTGIVIPIATGTGLLVLGLIVGLVFYASRRRKPTQECRQRRDSAKSYSELWKRARSSVIADYTGRRQGGKKRSEPASEGPHAAGPLLVTANE